MKTTVEIRDPLMAEAKKSLLLHRAGNQLMSFCGMARLILT